MNHVWVLGSANIDVTLRVPRIPESGETVLASERFVGTGGKGANQAIAIAHWGVPVRFIGAVGDDPEGALLARSLSEAGVNTENLARVHEVASGTAAVTVSDSGQNVITVFPGANQRISTDTIEKLPFRDGDIVVAQLEINVDAVLAAFRKARNIGATTILNPSPFASFDEELLADCTTLIANEHEASALGAVSVVDIETAAACAETIRDRGPDSIVITMGHIGATLHRRTDSFYCPAPTVAVVDTQGAGDAFLGAYISQLYQHGNEVEALQYATMVSAFSVTKMGSTQVSLPRRYEDIPFQQRPVKEIVRGR